VDFISILTLSAGLSINGVGLSTSNGSVTLSNNTYHVYLTVILQRYNSGTWSTVTYWTSDGYGYGGTSIEEDYYVAHGTYRVRSTATVYDQYGSFVEQATIYSATQTL
jgi:hypothetical protein